MTSRPLFYPREGGCNALWMTPEACGLWGLLDVLILTAASSQPDAWAKSADGLTIAMVVAAATANAWRSSVLVRWLRSMLPPEGT